MINFFVQRSHEYTIHYYQKVNRAVRIFAYDKLFRLKKLPAGCCVFTDLERLSPAETRLAGRVFKNIEAAHGRERLLNHPLTAMRRYELLRDLSERGLNGFNVYRLNERRWPKRYPVFLRGDADHGSIFSDLLKNRAELDEALKRMTDGGDSREDKLIVEYQNAAGADGLFRVHAAYVVGNRMVPSHLIISRRWDARDYDSGCDVEWAREEERAYLESNPHEAHLLEICRAAGIGYGRVDYGIVGGRIQIWEINTNPRILDPEEYPPRTARIRAFCNRFKAAFKDIAGASEERGTMAFAQALTIADRIKRWAKPALERLPYDIRYHMRGSRKRDR